MRKISGLLAAATLAIVGAISAQAASIGVQFTDNGGGGALTATDIAGVVPQANYNVNAADPATGSALKNDSGTATTAAYTASGARYGTGGGNFAGPNAAGNNNLVRGEILSLFGNPATFTFTGVPYATYDVYAYLVNDASGRASNISNGATTYYYTSETPGSNGNPNTTFDLVTSTSSTNLPVGNYVRFAGMTGAGFTLTLNVSGNGGLNAIQIVSTAVAPEPTTLGLAGLAATGVMLRRRRA